MLHERQVSNPALCMLRVMSHTQGTQGALANVVEVVFVKGRRMHRFTANMKQSHLQAGRGARHPPDFTPSHVDRSFRTQASPVGQLVLGRGLDIA